MNSTFATVPHSRRWDGQSQVDCSMTIMLKSEDELAYYIRIDRVFCAITGLLFSVGLGANVWVVQRIVRAIRRGSSTSPRHVMVYVGALAATDLSLLFNCPFLINDVANMKWNFGTFMCKWLYSNESINKLLTAFLLAALSFDQLITVRKIAPSSWRTVTAAWKIIVSLLFVATILLTPVFLYTRVVTLVDEQRDEDGNVTTQAIQKCVFAPPPDMVALSNGFTISMFVCGFCLPTLCIAVSYGNILRRFFASGYAKPRVTVRDGDYCTSRSMLQRHVDQRERRPAAKRNRRLITWYILLLVGIYLCCWTPYWVSTIGVTFLPQYYHDAKSDHLAATYTLLYIHLLPYLNAVLNAFAYGCMITFSSAKKQRGEKTEPGAARNERALTRLSLGETWSIGSGPDGQRGKTTRKRPSDIELSTSAQEELPLA